MVHFLRDIRAETFAVIATYFLTSINQTGEWRDQSFPVDARDKQSRSAHGNYGPGSMIGLFPMD